MHIEDLKPWHWILLGLLAGFAFGGAKLMGGPWFDTDNLTTLDDGSFESEVAGQIVYGQYPQLIPRHHANQPLIKNLVVHPPLADDPSHAYWVTGKIYDIILQHKDPKDLSTPIVPREQWNPFKYRAKSPYIARAGAPGSYSTVLQFLAAVQKNANPALQYSYDWWDKPLPTLLMPTAAGLLIIGFAWPLSLRLMQGMGVARAPNRNRVKYKPRHPEAKKAPVDNSAGELQLAQLNAQLDANLADFPSANQSLATTVATASTTATKPTPLQNPDAPGIPKTAEELAKEYGGEFYPVAKTTHKKE